MTTRARTDFEQPDLLTVSDPRRLHQYLQRVVRQLSESHATLHENVTQVARSVDAPLTPQQLAQTRAELQVGGQHSLNLTGLIGQLGQAQPPRITQTYAAKPPDAAAVPLDLGTLAFVSAGADKGLWSVTATTGGAHTWTKVATL